MELELSRLTDFVKIFILFFGECNIVNGLNMSAISFSVRLKKIKAKCDTFPYPELDYSIHQTEN